VPLPKTLNLAQTLTRCFVYTLLANRKIMTTEEILQSLCCYDKRNPDCTADDEDIEDHKARLLRVSKKLGYNKTCSCDNCFYGRTKLAEELLKVIAATNVAS
jgi:hypothetical protein